MTATSIPYGGPTFGRGAASPRPAIDMPALSDTARAARVTVRATVSGTVHVYAAGGRETIGRLQCNSIGWRGVDDITGDSTDSCTSAADALGLLLAMVGYDAAVTS